MRPEEYEFRPIGPSGDKVLVMVLEQMEEISQYKLRELDVRIKAKLERILNDRETLIEERKKNTPKTF